MEPDLCVWMPPSMVKLLHAWKLIDSSRRLTSKGIERILHVVLRQPTEAEKETKVSQLLGGK